MFGCKNHESIADSSNSITQTISQNEEVNSSCQTSLPETITKKDVGNFKKEHPKYGILDEVYVNKDGLLNAAVTYFDKSTNFSVNSNVHLALFTKYGIGNLTIGDKNYTFSNDLNGKISIVDDVTKER